MTIHIAPYDGGSPPNGIELPTRGSYGPVENFLMAKMVNGLSMIQAHLLKHMKNKKGLQRSLDILT